MTIWVSSGRLFRTRSRVSVISLITWAFCSRVTPSRVMRTLTKGMLESPSVVNGGPSGAVLPFDRDVPASLGSLRTLPLAGAHAAIDRQHRACGEVGIGEVEDCIGDLARLSDA